MNLIVAVDQNWGIGKNNDLLFHIPEDMKFFRETTIDKNVICGKNTLFSFPGQKPLPRRHHFVLTHSDLEPDENVTLVRSVDDLLASTAHLPSDDLFVIGGGSVYQQLYPLCKTAFVTRVMAEDSDADVFFPNLDLDDTFELVSEGELLTSKNGLLFQFLIYENKKSDS